MTSFEAEQAIEQIVKRAQTDSQFRQLCLDNPNSAAQQVIGKDIPEGFTLRFVENQGADLTVVLPDSVDAEAELAEQELEQVAGGNNKCQGTYSVIPYKLLNIARNYLIMNEQTLTSLEAEQAIEQIIKRAQTDIQFRQLCLDNPNCAAQKVIGKDMPEGFTLRFVENENADLTVVLPDLVDGSAELSDAELEQVAGGKCLASCGGTSLI